MILGLLPATLAGSGVGLAGLPFAELQVSTAAPAAEGERILVNGPFRLVGVAQGVRSYEAPIPVRPRALFFTSPPEGMTLKRGGTSFRFGADPDDAILPGTWLFSAHSITVRVKADAPPPQPGEFVLTYPAAQEREDALWRARSGAADDAAFVRRSAQVDDVTRDGLYLPAPSVVGWDVTVPERGVLRMQVGVLPPEIADAATSDGADVEVRVNGELAGTARAQVRDFTDVSVQLDRWAGQSVRLSVTTKDHDTTRDHVLVAAPSLYTPSDKPRRAVLVFLDTMRRDHLGVYGYQRGASPKLDAWAKDAVVFDDARSVAPWTLPSTRSALSGLEPEHWADARTLPERMAALGWATAAYVGNVYLSSNFDMSGGWGEHGCVNWPYARLEVDRTLDFLERHPDQDALVMVHFMDLHLPYKEPWNYRGIYEQERPAGLFEGFSRTTLLAAARGNREKVRDYIVARYDQNLRYVDDQLARLLRGVGDDATVVVFADHGEEFFDHGDLEHGHTLYDELLRIPMIVKSPGLAPRRVSTPVSLLDLTPTVLDLLGAPDPSLAGRSLVGLARGEADPALESRPLGFGRPLYGDEAWGSLSNKLKYISRSGKELLFDLGSDPGEQNNLRPDRDPTESRAAMAAALQRETGVGFRLAPKGKGSGAFTVEMCVPGGVARAWVGDDPTNHSSATVEQVDEELVRASFTSPRGNHREVFVIPRVAAQQVAPSVTVRVARDGLEPVSLGARAFDGFGDLLAKVSSAGRTLEVTYASLPFPAGQAVVGADDELNAALEALGYMARDDEDASPEPSGAPEPSGTASPLIGPTRCGQPAPE